MTMHNRGDMTTPTTAPAKGNGMVSLGFLMLAAAVIFIAFSRIHTLATGQDPRIFLVLARQIAGQHFSMASIREVADFVIPGYPIFLAAVISIFDVEAAFMVNSFLLTLLFILLNRLFYRIMRNEWQAGIMTLFCLAGLLAGYPRNAHFLLLGFRNTPTYLCMAGAMLLLKSPGRGEAGRFPWMTLCSGLFVIAGISIRETVILIIPCLLLYIWCGKKDAHGLSRQAHLMAFLLPFMVGGGVAVAYLLFHPGILLNSQSRQLLNMLPLILNPAGNRLAFGGMLDFFMDEIGYIGIALICLGLWNSKKRPEFFYFFFLPAIAFFIFYGAIKTHRRFFLTVLFFLLPIMALGVAVVLDWLHQRAHRKAALLVYIPATLLLVLWCGYLVAPLSVWGVKVTSNDVQAITRILNQEAPEETTLLVDRRTRHLLDVLTVFTDYQTLDVSDPKLKLVRDPPFVFLCPVNQAAIHRLEHGLDGRDAVRRQGNLEFTGSRFFVGDGEFEVARVRPWPHNTADIQLPRPSSYPAILRINIPQLWGDNSTRSRVEVKLDDRVVQEQMDMGVHFICVETPPAGSTHRLTIESDAPVPDDVDPVWLRMDEFINMNFGESASPSYDHFLSAEFFEFPAADPDTRELVSSGDIRLPIAYPSNTYLMAMLGASTVHDEPARLVEVIFSSGDHELTRARMPASSKSTPLLVHFGRMADHPIERLNLSFKLQEKYHIPPPDQRGWNFKVHNLILYPVMLGEPLHLDFGSRRDTPFLVDGFWSREQGPKGTGRWTSGKASVNIFLQPGIDYRLRAEFQTQRSASAPPAQPSFLFNGHLVELERESDDAIYIAPLPADWVIGPSNTLEINSSPWRPIDYAVSRDQRELGIFMQNILIEAAPPDAARVSP